MGQKALDKTNSGIYSIIMDRQIFKFPNYHIGTLKN